MRNTRRPVCIALAILLSATPLLAQQPIQDSAKRAAESAAASAQPASSGNRTRFITGAIIAAAGGATLVLGMTAFKTADATSGNTPEGAYDTCVAQRVNPVYRANDCDVLKGPRTSLVIGGAVAAAAGVTLMLLGRPSDSVESARAGSRFAARCRSDLFS